MVARQLLEYSGWLLGHCIWLLGCSQAVARVLLGSGKSVALWLLGSLYGVLCGCKGIVIWLLGSFCGVLGGC